MEAPPSWALHQAAASKVKEDQPFKTFQIRSEVTRPDLLHFFRDLLAVFFPIPDKVSLALRAFEHRHDFVRRQGSEIGGNQNPTGKGVRKDTAREVPVEHLSLPGGKHIPNSSHALSVPENLPGDSQLLDIEGGRSTKIH